MPFHNPKLALVMFWEKAKECNRKNGYAKYVCTFAPRNLVWIIVDACLDVRLSTT